MERVQSSYHFSDYEMKQLRYTIQALSSELIKTILLSLLFFHLGHLTEFLVGTIVLISIRCNSGGLHMNHFLTCFLFTCIFMLTTIIVLPHYVTVPWIVRPFVLALCIGITYLMAPVASKKRPPATAAVRRRYRNASVRLLIVYSLLIVFLKTSPLAIICFWVIVIQTLQLLCAFLARKGEGNEKIQ